MSYKNRDDDSTKIHHTLTGFKNTEPFLIKSKDIKKWKRERKVLPPEGGYGQFKSTWYQHADFSINEDAIWWLGHATSLIRIGDKNILTDPVFSDRVSPVTFAGPKRRTPPACLIQELPQIDIIVISHNHYDHLDYFSIKPLLQRFPLVTIVVPQGLKAKLLSWGAKQVIELDWWNDTIADGVLFTSIPARHWSRRGLFDENKSLWCGWMIQYQNKTIYFMGDTGYSPKFEEIKHHFAHIDVALIPIGCYAPRWFMQNQHIDPEQALQLFHILGCKKAMAIHWGAFELADEPLDEPPKLLKSLYEQYHIEHEQFSVIKIGQYLPI